jgi:hypothetical protein
MPLGIMGSAGATLQVILFFEMDFCKGLLSWQVGGDGGDKL